MIWLWIFTGLVALFILFMIYVILQEDERQGVAFLAGYNQGVTDARRGCVKYFSMRQYRRSTYWRGYAAGVADAALGE